MVNPEGAFFMRSILILVFLFLILLISWSLADSIPSNVNPVSINADSSAQMGTVSATEAQSDVFTYPMSPERKEKLISYSRFTNIWRFASFAIDLIIILAFLYSGLSGRFQAWAGRIFKRKILVWLFYFILLMVFLFLTNLPFSYYRDFIVEHNYGFSNQTTGEWLGESLKSQAIGLIFGFPIIAMLYWLINKFKKWWLFFAIGAIPIMVFVIIIVPVVVSPLFNKFEPIKNQELAGQITAMAEKAGIHNPDIYEVDASKQSNKINAYFTGMFGTKRIVLYDTIIKNFSIKEIKFVMGHEIGHYLKNHIWYGLFVAIGLLFLGGFLADKLLHAFIANNSRRFGFSRLGDIASIPVLILFMSIFGFISQPVSNSISRTFEYQSDKYGMELSGITGDEAATAFDKLSVFNLSDPEPSAIIEFWFYNHPALQKRMENVRRLYARSQSGG
jgi:STE24 endopeptidase